jgi:hypothetical protein
MLGASSISNTYEDAMSNKLDQIPLELMAAEVAKAYVKIAEWQDRRFKRMGAAMAKPLDPPYFEKMYQELRDK